MSCTTNNFLSTSGYPMLASWKICAGVPPRVHDLKDDLGGSIQYPCDQCEYKATKKGSLKSHIESVHEKVQYPCNQCEYKATQNGNLKRHIQTIHDIMN